MNSFGTFFKKFSDKKNSFKKLFFLLLPKGFLSQASRIKKKFFKKRPITPTLTHDPSFWEISLRFLFFLSISLSTDVACE